MYFDVYLHDIGATKVINLTRRNTRQNTEGYCLSYPPLNVLGEVYLVVPSFSSNFRANIYFMLCRTVGTEIRKL